MKNTLVSIMLLLMCHVSLVAQSPQLFTSSEGLSFSQIESLCKTVKDISGFLHRMDCLVLMEYSLIHFIR